MKHKKPIIKKRRMVIFQSDICDIYEQFLKCELFVCDNCPAIKAYHLLEKNNLVEIKRQSLRGGKGE